jgi:hypothetical protein
LYSLYYSEQRPNRKGVAGVPAEVEFAMKENKGEDMKLFDVEMLKDMSVEDMERLRREIKNLSTSRCETTEDPRLQSNSIRWTG